MADAQATKATEAKSYSKKQKEPRVPKKIRVAVRGTDTNGNEFKQTVHTINVSRSGARLDGPACLKGPGEVILVKRRWKKARFRVVWVGDIGTPEAYQIGICILEPDKDKKVW